MQWPYTGWSTTIYQLGVDHVYTGWSTTIYQLGVDHVKNLSDPPHIKI